MRKHIVYKTEGVCASKIEFDLEDGRVYHVQFHGGCKGNVQGIARLADGRDPEELIHLCKGIDCHNNNSCPHQFALALEKTLQV